jgi:mannose-6-phosphate isomerase-like protein (cupin superfamily)
MNVSRRELGQWLAAAAAASCAASGAAAEETSLESFATPFDKFPVRSSNGNAFRQVVNGRTHTGEPVEIQETDLAPGAMPHAPHHHTWEEFWLIREGTVEITIAGKATRLGPGGVGFVASGEEHGIRNVGEGHAQYFVVALGQQTPSA